MSQRVIAGLMLFVLVFPFFGGVGMAYAQEEKTMMVHEPVVVYGKKVVKRVSESPWYKKPWVWGLLAIVAGGVVIAADDDDAPSSGTLTVTGPQI